MQSRFIFLLAWRYLRGSTLLQSTRIMMIIAAGTIFLSTCCLALTLAIMTGFQQATLQTLQGIHATIIISIPQQAGAYEQIEEVLRQEPSISSYSPNYYAHALLHTSQENNLGSLLLLHGIDPLKEEVTTRLASFIQSTSSKKSLSETLEKNTVIIGERLAKKYTLSVGDSFQFLYPINQQAHKNNLTFDTVTGRVGALIKTGIEELDSSLVLMHYDFFTDLWPESMPITLSVNPNQFYKDSEVVAILTSKVSAPIHPWYELYPTLLAALQLETLITTLVVGLFTLMASVIIGALIFMIITTKRFDIALLRAMGASIRTIKSIFFYVGMCITSIASLAGIIGAYVTGWILKHWLPISLPDIYIVQHVPVNLNPIIFIQVLIFVIAISTLATWLACRCIPRLPLSETLRFER